MDFDIKSGDRICIVGPNGIGKTTLLRIMIGDQVPTGGYLIGFVAIALLMMAWKKAMGSKWVIVSMVLGLAVCYLFGTVWFVRVYANNGNAVTFMTALGWCVFPYIIPDLLKIALARLIGSRVKTALKQK